MAQERRQLLLLIHKRTTSPCCGSWAPAGVNSCLLTTVNKGGAADPCELTAAQFGRLRGGVPGLPAPHFCPLESTGLRTWNEHTNSSSTRIMAPELSNSPQ